MKTRNTNVNTIDELFDLWFASVWELFDKSKGRTKVQAYARARETGIEDILILKELHKQVSNNEEFLKETTIIYDCIVKRPTPYLTSWTRDDREKARNKRFLKRKFKEYFYISYSMEMIIENKREPDFLKALVACYNTFALKYISTLFEEYFLFHKTEYYSNPNFKEEDLYARDRTSQ